MLIELSEDEKKATIEELKNKLHEMKRLSIEAFKLVEQLEGTDPEFEARFAEVLADLHERRIRREQRQRDEATKQTTSRPRRRPRRRTT